jgi:hypothetical protein
VSTPRTTAQHHAPGRAVSTPRTTAQHHTPGRAVGTPRTAAQLRAGARRGRQRLCMTSRTSPAVSLGVLPTRTPTFSSASFLAPAVPADPEMIAPA